MIAALLFEQVGRLHGRLETAGPQVAPLALHDGHARKRTQDRIARIRAEAKAAPRIVRVGRSKQSHQAFASQLIKLNVLETIATQQVEDQAHVRVDDLFANARVLPIPFQVAILLCFIEALQPVPHAAHAVTAIVEALEQNKLLLARKPALLGRVDTPPEQSLRGTALGQLFMRDEARRLRQGCVASRMLQGLGILTDHRQLPFVFAHRSTRGGTVSHTKPRMIELP